MAFNLEMILCCCSISDDFAFNMDKGFRMNITDIDGLSHRNSGNSKVTVINDTLDAPCINVKIMYDEQIVIHGESCFPRYVC